jgi:ADP-ribose pyrophosphatase YjhB (NUDIX family)
MPYHQKMPESFQSYKPHHMKVYGAICINSKGEVLLVRGRKGQKWSFPKGHIEPNEKAIECARRELKEEAGIVAPETYVSYHKLHAAYYYVFAIEGTPDLMINDTHEIDMVQWVSLTSLPTESCNVDISIFRTLMKNIRDEQTCMDYIQSSYAHRRINYIREGIENSKLQKQVAIKC